ncbi:Uncharacterised protein [Candidatus Gugararchaeum adminiculabundum]|nr:Uncharacterised protein [Candidatus Gugararchaeum adminiculabundum]
MEEADKLCQRIAIMDHGKIIALGTPSELKEKYGGYHEIQLKLDRYDQKLLGELKSLVAAKDVQVQDDIITLYVPTIAGDVLYRVSNFLSGKRITVHDLRGSEPSLEDVFINLTKKDVRD